MGQSGFKGHLMTECGTEGESNKGEISVLLKLRKCDVVHRDVFLLALIGRLCGTDAHLIDFNTPLCSRHMIRCRKALMH